MTEPQARDTARLDALEEQCADVELTCGGVWRVSAVNGDYEADTLRAAIDAMIADLEEVPK